MSATAARIGSVPPWYRRKCDALSRAVWRGQVTEREAGLALAVWHAAWFAIAPPETPA